MRESSYCLFRLRGVAVDYGGAAADAGGEGWPLQAFEDGSGNVGGIDMVRVELGEGEEVGALVVDELRVGHVGLDDRGVRERGAKEVDRVPDGVAGGRAVRIEVDVLALGELRDGDE